jgi:fructose-1,6-bisphosphatase I
VRDFAELIEKRRLTLRYGGSLVGDFTQVLTKGGFFAYPELIDAPLGKYRLNFEASPIAFIAEKAGGKASTGSGRILDVEPTRLAQRIPTYLGNLDLVTEFDNSFANQQIL